jgi:hypothetical protein
MALLRSGCKPEFGGPPDRVSLLASPSQVSVGKSHEAQGQTSWPRSGLTPLESGGGWGPPIHCSRGSARFQAAVGSTD